MRALWLAGDVRGGDAGSYIHTLEAWYNRTAIPMTREYIQQESARLRAIGEVPEWRFDQGMKEAAE